MIASIRAVRFVIHLLVGLVLAAVVNLDFTRRVSGERAMSWWCNVLLDVLNIQLRVHGEPAQGARFSVANHVSWLDMILIGACEPTRFVSKAEVRDWPVLGFITRAAGTFYLRRGKGGTAPRHSPAASGRLHCPSPRPAGRGEGQRRSRWRGEGERPRSSADALMERLVPHLAKGGSVMVFPEGTTTDGRRVKPFFPRLFAAAIDAQCFVQPIALRYGPGEDGEDVAPFIGDDDMVSHLLRVLRTSELGAELHYCQPFPAAGETREALAERAQAEIQRVIGAQIRVLAAVEAPLAA